MTITAANTQDQTHHLLLSALLECVVASPTLDSGTVVVGTDSIAFPPNKPRNATPGHVHSKSDREWHEGEYQML